MLSEGSFTALSSDELLKRRIERYNAMPGDLEGYDCPKCRNKGDLMYIKDGVIYTAQCECAKVRLSLKRLKKSGLHRLTEEYTFDGFIADEQWQRVLKESAVKFSQNPDGWFFIGGQPGSGKTHLCTAVVHELIKRGKSAKYMLWRDDVTVLKGMVNEGESYRRYMDEYKKADVLYIDDFFKVKRGEQPTAADVNIAFEIVNFRYNDFDKITVFSSELAAVDILRLDEALGSRIIDRCRGFNQFVGYNPEKNYRLCRGAL